MGTVSLAPYEFQELCFELATQDEARYDLRSDQPVELMDITVHTGKFVTELDQIHCLVWFNRKLTGTSLNYRTSGP